MIFNDVQTFIKGLIDGTAAEGWAIIPGPITSPGFDKTSSGGFIFAQFGNGAGLTVEALYERPFIIIRVVGPQGDYDTAEDVARIIDHGLLKPGTSLAPGLGLYVDRTGGRPQLVDYDSANRYHFQCTYITETQSGIYS